MTLLHRVQETLHSRDESRRVAPRRHPRAPVTHRRAVGYRRVIVVDRPLDRAAVAELRAAFWDSIEAGARDIWIDLSRTRTSPPEAVVELARLEAFAHELGRHMAIIAPPGPAQEPLRRESALEVHESLASAHRASR
jgi:hypothetical protein